MLWEIHWADYVFITLILGGGAAYMTGRAVANGWGGWLRLLIYLFLLSCAVRFFHYALVDGTLLTLHYHAIDLATLIIFGLIGRNVTRQRQMTRQYAWLFERTSPLSWRRKA
ncbi:MAG: hypothetical protein D6754_10595 [Alphaproteobacteria bacterium]|nr:MAG: hypothetical protein D6754_10595 [Alphaproteobacteria bacterium]